MEVVCEATQSTNTQVKVAALQCLVKIMSLYYQYMEAYMAPALFPVNIDFDCLKIHFIKDYFNNTYNFQLNRSPSKQ